MENPRYDLVELVLTNRPYTGGEQNAIGAFVTRQLAEAEAVREYVRRNPVPFELVELRQRQYRPGCSPAPEVMVYQVVPLPLGGRAGQVQQDENGKWLGYHFNDAPGEFSFGRGNGQRQRRETQEEAVVDVIARHLVYSGAVRFVEDTGE
ncbi:hypothetical protein [Streptosporangium sp. CA-115845]|uniref:hypothetical protein n=1 Tax=Streptosporangium sp. CA-115845 TaxID=3240071 RepID=UPI003D93EA9C